MNSKYSHVFRPIRIRGIDFKNRITLAPPSPNLASDDHLVTRDLVNWFRMFARGGCATIYAGNVSIDITESRDEAYQLDLSSDRCILPMTMYADMAKEYGCHASFEINHNGENTAFDTVGHAPFSSSPRISENELRRAARAGREPVSAIEMSKEKIAETVEKFGMAAERMKRAGMDIAMIHGGHGNLISQFTSPLYNHRTDEYGGSLENRARFAIEVCDSVRRHCGEDFVIEYRISADEIAPGGMHFDETLQLIGLLKDHIDIIHVSAGLHSDFHAAYFRNWCQNYMMDRCFNVHFARDVKKAYPDLLVNTVGSIVSLDYAEEILANGWADFVSMCRPLMADPDMPRKYAEGHPEDRRPCLRCDNCTRHVMIPKPIFCAVNPMSFKVRDLPDGVVPPAPVKKRVAVVGGGPGGIQAMQTLLDRGHDVTLYEATGELGGNLIPAVIPDYKQDLRDYLDWLRRTAQKCAERGAKILMNTPATKALLDAEHYDAVIIAVGADPLMPDSVPGIHGDNVLWAPEGELEENKARVGQRVVVIGAGSIGVEAAHDMHLLGKEVTVVEALDAETAFTRLRKANSGNAAREFREILKADGVDVRYSHRVKEITPEGVICENLETGETVFLPADTVLTAMGMQPRLDIVDTLRHCAPETSVRFIGDCHQPDTVCGAVNEAFQACLHI